MPPVVWWFIATIYADGLLTNITCWFVLLARQLVESSSGLSERIGGKKQQIPWFGQIIFQPGYSIQFWTNPSDSCFPLYPILSHSVP
jgi:hypothetical protein